MYVYIIECSDGSFYTGVAKDIEKRLKQHYYHKKSSAKYTKSHQMVALKALWQTETKQNAMKLEYHIKKLTHSKKLELIKNSQNLSTLIPNKITSTDYIFINSTNQQIIMHKIKKEEEL